MLSISPYINKLTENFSRGKKMRQEDQEYQEYQEYQSNEVSPGLIFLGSLLDLIVASLFIMFSYTYIDKIDPTLEIKNKLLYLVLVYMLLLGNGVQFISSLINMFTSVVM